jgi:hypothetical protein
VTAGDRAFAAATAACPFVNHDAVRRILAAAAPHHRAEAVAADREWLKRVLGEAKEALAYPANGYLLDAVTWAHVLDALSPDPEGISDGT